MASANGALLSVPIIVTVEDPAKGGPTTGVIRSVLPTDCADLEKHVFGLAGQRDILGGVKATGRHTAILCGMETDVCVLHSALGLQDQGFSAAVVADATATAGSGPELGIERMRQAGITVVSCKILLYEWLRTLGKSQEFFKRSGISPPEGLVL